MSDRMPTPPLGAVPPPDDEHLRKYPLALAARPQQVGPMVIGTEMFESFTAPVQRDGAWWIGLDPKALGRSLGGHAMCLMPDGWKDVRNGWQQYDQGMLSSCVGHSSSRVQSLYNRTIYDGNTLYLECKKRDGYAGDGTYIRVAFDVLRERGPWRRSPAGRVTGPLPAHGILENRWTTDIDEAARWLGLTGEHATILNSWGTGYPREVRIPLETLDILSRRDGTYLELAAVTDRPGPSPTT